jgi:outer membrane protein OmpA-like peptidoglycan-associated protein/uncharacterized protein (DUF433 family)
MTRLWLYISVIFFSCSFSARGQFFKKKEQKKGEKIELQSDSVTIEITDIVFKNINKVSLYTNSKQLKKIEELDKAENWKELYPVLQEYVSNFGVQNFAYQTYYLWRLAKLTEVFGTIDQARPLYSMVLKHHRSGLPIEEILSRYDAINPNRIQNYVPLEYYYDLVEYRRQVDTLIPPRGVLTTMGKKINSLMEDYAPNVAREDKVLLFTSKRNSHNEGIKVISNEDIFISEDLGEGWSEAKPFAGINSKYNEGSATLTKDGKTIFFSRCGAPDSYGNCDLYTSVFQGDTLWTEPKNMGNYINSKGWDSHPTLSPAEDTLFFSSDRQGGFGLADLYFSPKSSRGIWGPPQNLGPIVNTRQNEVSPFYHPDHNVLYFSSNGHLLNFGDYDIYKTYKFGVNFSEPINIGPLVNGTGTEFYFSIDKASRDIFYSRSGDESMKNLDLYSFPLPMGGQPLANTRFSGKIQTVTGKLPQNVVVSIIDLDKGVEVAPKFARDDGTFEFDLINQRNYLVVIQGDDFFRLEKMFFLDGETEYEGIIERVASKIEFASLEFENGKWNILASMESDLDKVLDFLIDHPSFKLNVSGHTDSSGDALLNLTLSQRRADAIKTWIVDKGVDPNRINAIGYGSNKPIITVEKTDDDRALNRRVEFEIYREAVENDENKDKP